MSDARYLRNDIGSLLGHVTEECGEVLTAIGKTMRWGLDSANPELPPAERETNRDWILRELSDLDLAISRLRKALTPAAREKPSPTGDVQP